MTNLRRAAVSGLALSSLFAIGATAGAEPAQKIFERSCAPCHGKAGKPSPIFAQQGVKDFTDGVWQKATGDAEIEKTIHEGKKGTMMAAFGTQYSSAEIKALAAYVRKLGGKK